MPEKRKSTRLAELEAAAPQKKVKYTEVSESDIESDYDSDDESVASVESEIDPEEAARAAELAAKDAQIARNQIRDLLDKLPADQSDPILKVIDDADSWEKPGARYPWSNLPAEIKNRIYEYTFLSDAPMKPHVHHPQTKDRRRLEKFNLGANLLRCSKEIYKEGRAILYSDNIFEVDIRFREGLGLNINSGNFSLVRKIILHDGYMSAAMWRNLRQLQNIQELTIRKDPATWEYYRHYTPPTQSDIKAMAKKFSSLRFDTNKLLDTRTFAKIFFVWQQQLTVSGFNPHSQAVAPLTASQDRDWDKANMVANRIAVRFLVEKTTEVDFDNNGPEKVWVFNGYKLTYLAEERWLGAQKPHVLIN